MRVRICYGDMHEKTGKQTHMPDILYKLRRVIPPKYKYFAIFLIVMMGCSAILELGMLGLLMPLVLAVSNPGATAGGGRLSQLYRLCGAPSEHVFIIYLAAAMIAFAILKAGFNYLMIWSQSRFVADLTRILTKNLVSNYVSAPYLFHVRNGMSELMNRVQSIRTLLAQVFQPLLLVFSEIFVIAALFLGICFIMPAAAGLVLLLGIFSLFAYLPLKKKIEKLGQEQFVWAGKYQKALLQAFATIKEVKLSCDESCFINSVVDARWNLSRAEKKTYDISQLPRLMIELFAVVLAMLILIFLVGTNTSLSHIIMYAAVFIAAMFRLLPSFTRIQYNLVYIRGGVFILNKLYEDLTDFKVESLKRSEVPIRFERELSIRDLSFAYGEIPVFDHFSATIRHRECVAFTGPSGSGKTTLADLIIGFLTPDSGAILADGISIFENLKAWRAKIGYVSQNIYLLDDTVRSNIAFCREEDIDDAKVAEVMKTAQIFDFVQTLPEKEYTTIGEFGMRLSGGQRQRIAIARALYQQPELLILDEATSALDNETEKAFIDALHALKGSITIIMIAHRLSSLEYCDRTIALEAPQRKAAAGSE